jgi:hypothetical protein
MKSLATTFLLFATCIVVAGTVALIDRAQATLSSSSGDTMEVARAEVAAARNATTLSEFANYAQETFALSQPERPVAFDDVQPSDADYTAAQAVYPFLHRQLLCPECALTSNFYGKHPLTRAGGNGTGQHSGHTGQDQPPHSGGNLRRSRQCSRCRLGLGFRATVYRNGYRRRASPARARKSDSSRATVYAYRDGCAPQYRSTAISALVRYGVLAFCKRGRPMNTKENSMRDIHLQQLDIWRDGKSAPSVTTPVPYGARLAAERITTALLLVICIVAAAFM